MLDWYLAHKNARITHLFSLIGTSLCGLAHMDTSRRRPAPNYARPQCKRCLKAEQKLEQEYSDDQNT